MSSESARPLQLIALCGLRGVGKSTVLQQLNELDPAIKVIFMSRELKAFSVETTKKDLFEHEIAARNVLRDQFGNYLIERLKSERGIVVLDIHFIDIRESASNIIQPQILIRAIDAFVFLDASNDTIIRRRIKDRELSLGRSFAVLEIQREREAHLAAVQQLATEYFCPFFILSAEKTIDEICSQLTLIFKKINASEEDRGDGIVSL